LCGKANGQKSLKTILAKDNKVGRITLPDNVDYYSARKQAIDHCDSFDGSQRNYAE
jgi:hypothetical protein